jgi:2-C-methyl-D-erythritol 4-phosphate cytidylyltransferase
VIVSKFAVIIPAAGRSTRFGGLEKKPFVHLGGRPIWQRSAELFWTRPDVSTVYLVISSEDRDEFRSRFGHVIAFANAEIVEGGAERADSIANALTAVPHRVEFVAVHDAVRPLATSELIDTVFAAALSSGAAIPAIPVVDTLKRSNPNNTIEQTVPRDGLYQAQTPQVFRREWLVNAYAHRTALKQPISDDSQLIEIAGHPVTIVNGSRANFKITTRDDLALAELLVKNRYEREPEKPLASFHDEAKW